MQVPAKDGMSEDCLYLNVWRPRKSGVFPVMVWIHGGGYVMGSGGGGIGGAGYEGSSLATLGDVVVVTINYRLHLFGFLADPALREEDPNKSTGNYGSLDQAAAIRWVHDNIAGFGGDPANVTIFGESAGGWSICTMLATPRNRGMFQRAILESGGCEKSEDLEAGYERGRAIAAKVGCQPGDLNCLRAVPAKKFMQGSLVALYREGMAYAPHHDGYLLTGTPLSMIRAGDFNRVPFLAGFNRNEVDAVLVARPQLWNALPFQYEAVIQRNLGLTPAESARLMALYALRDFDNRPRQAYGKMFTDVGLACPTYLGLDALANQGLPTFFYRFDFDRNRYGKRIGALHALEVPLVFNMVASGDGGIYRGDGLPAARALARTIEGYWTNFAKSGDPNGPGLPAWPQFQPEARNLLVLDEAIRVEPAGMAERCAFWEEYADRHPTMETTLGRRQKEK
jgi:para-nitrobenzyl esterase